MIISLPTELLLETSFHYEKREERGIVVRSPSQK